MQEEKKKRSNFKVEPINLSEQSVKDNTSAFDTDFLGMNRKTFLLDKMWEAQSFDLSKKYFRIFQSNFALY